MYVRKRDEGLSAARVRRIHGVLSSALNHAVRWRLVARNVCKEVSPPQVPPPKIRSLSMDEAGRFLVAAEGDRFEALEKEAPGAFRRIFLEERGQNRLF